MAGTQSRISDTGSNYNFEDKMIDPKLERSRFDCSYTNYFTAEQGVLYPCYLQFFQPYEDITLSVSSFLRILVPPTVPLLSRQRVFFHYYAVTMPQIWKQFQTFMTKGRSGSVVGTVPQISVTDTNANLISRLGRGSLFDFLIGQLPQSVLSGDASVTSTVTFNALPFMAYQRVFRDYYLNQYLNNTQLVSGFSGDVWFPYDDADFRLDGLNLIANVSGYASDVSSSDYLFNIDLTSLRSRNYADDYFTTARLSPQLGEEASVNGDITAINNEVGIVLDDVFRQLNVNGTYGYDSSGSSDFSSVRASGSGSDYTLYRSGNPSNVLDISYGALSTLSSTETYSQRSSQTSFPLVMNPDLSAALSLTASNIRDLLVLSRIQEKHARIDGSYSDYIKTFFDKRPRSGQHFRPTYIGGSYQPVTFTEVLQQSESSTSPLGTIGGAGYSQDNGFIGRYESDDFGFIIGLMSIVPDTIYSTGVNRTLLYKVQEDFPLPERNDLGMQAIYNKELFWSGNDTVDSDLFGYQDRMDELRYRANEIHGDFAGDTYDDLAAYTQYRKITSTPTLTQSFVGLENNVNNDWLSVTTQSPYGCQVYTRCEAVKPLPYRAMPVGLL